MSTFKGNGITIEYPGGYRCFKDYVKMLHINLRILCNRNNPKDTEMITRYKNNIKQANKAL